MLAIFVLLVRLPVSVCQVRPDEYAVKADFLLNFAKFIDWPPAKFSSEQAALVIGVVGEDPFGQLLDSAIRNKTINKHPLVVRRLVRSTALKDCHILFVSRSEQGHFDEIAAVLEGAAVLTVSETDQFLDHGGMINFWVESKEVKLQISVQPAESEGLKISSRLLHLPLVQIKSKP